MEKSESKLQRSLVEHIDRLGARSWIIISEAAFPIRASSQVKVLPVNKEIPNIFLMIDKIIEAKQALQTQIYLTRELGYLSKQITPGSDVFQSKLKHILNGREVLSIDNDMLMRMYENIASKYRVLIIKTQTTLPYSSIFLEIQSAYWSQDSDCILREFIEKKTSANTEE